MAKLKSSRTEMNLHTEQSEVRIVGVPDGRSGYILEQGERTAITINRG